MERCESADTSRIVDCNVSPARFELADFRERYCFKTIYRGRNPFINDEKNDGRNMPKANELIPERAKYYSHFYPKVDMVVGDIMEKNVFSTYLKKAKTANPKFLLATPPCQGMSSLGKKDYVEDERNYLIFSVLRISDCN